MTWREFWLFLHLLAAMVWIGGAVAIQVFGILTKRAADPAKSAFFAANVSWTVSRIFLPASIVIFIAGVGLKVQEHWSWSEPFLVYGVVAWALVSLVAFGYLGQAIGRAGMQLASEGPSPALGLRMRNLVWLSRVLLLALLTIAFMMTVKLGT
jgi:uncharacterized membrane protein